MKRIAATIVAVSIGAAAVFGPVPARAQSAPTPVLAPALDPEMQRLFMTLATSVLTSFAANAAKGSLEGFDPGPAIEAAFRSALASRDINAAVERLVDQAGRNVDGGGVASPEMRALLKVALSGVVAMARSEIAREFSNVPATGQADSP